MECEGLYSFWGLDFINEYILAHITEIFNAETDANYLIFLGDQEEIDKVKKEWYDDSDYVYAVFSANYELEGVHYRDDISGETIKFDIRFYMVTELRELEDYNFYDFLRQYAKLSSMPINCNFY